MGLARVLQKSAVSVATVEPGDCRFSADGAYRLMAHGLGSDVVVTAHAPQAGISALLRLVSPDSRVAPAKAKDNPWLFADTGVSLLIATLRQYGASDSEMEVQAIGAAHFSMEESAIGNGRSNELAVRKALWTAGILLHHADLGGAMRRTVCFDSASNRLLVRSETSRLRSSGSFEGSPVQQHKAS